MTTGLLYDERFLLHEVGKQHPEKPERVSGSFAYLKELPWFSELKLYKAAPADLKWVEEVHDPRYIEHAKRACEQGSKVLDSADVEICEKSFEVALLAAGGAILLGNAVMEGEIDNGFGLIRPPGHHAEKAQAMGFCLFNNIAILARYLQKEHGLKRVLIFDWDVHHGNGTQHIFEDDPSVFYVSTHQFPHYPGTGAKEERGILDGTGATLNIPFGPGADDDQYEIAYETEILPRIQKFNPDVVLISAGFDAHKEDPLAYVNLSTEWFGWMTGRLKELSGGRVISLLEGGYNLSVLPQCVASHVQALL